MAAVLASLNIFCSLTASVSRRFCRNSAQERRKRATLLGPSILGVLKAVHQRARCSHACGSLRVVHKRRHACSYLLHDLPSVARRPYSAHAQQLSIESQRARHWAQAATNAARAGRFARAIAGRATSALSQGSNAGNGLENERTKNESSTECAGAVPVLSKNTMRR